MPLKFINDNLTYNLQQSSCLKIPLELVYRDEVVSTTSTAKLYFNFE